MVSTRRKTYSPRTAQVVSSPRRVRARPGGNPALSASKEDSRKPRMEICDDETIKKATGIAGPKPAKVQEVMKVLPAIETVLEKSEMEHTDQSGNDVKEAENKENRCQQPPLPGQNQSKQHARNEIAPIGEKNNSKVIKGANVSGRFWKTAKPRWVQAFILSSYFFIFPKVNKIINFLGHRGLWKFQD